MKPVLWRSRKQCYFALGFSLVSLLPLLIPLVCFQTALYHTSVQMPSVVSCIWPYIIYVLFLLCFHLFPFSSPLPCMLATLLSNRFPPQGLCTCSLWLETSSYRCKPIFFPLFLQGFYSLTSQWRVLWPACWRLQPPAPALPYCGPAFLFFFCSVLSPSADSCVLLGRKLMFVHGRIVKSWSVLGI